MTKRVLYLIAFAIASALTTLADGQTEKTAFTFQPGQAVYVVSFRNDGKPDLTAESEVWKAFEKKKVFKLVGKQEEADYVFVLYTDYTRPHDFLDRGSAGELMTGAVAMALTRDSYNLHKGDLEALRAAALWQILASQGRMVTIINGRSTLARKAVDKFHKSVLKKS